MRTRRLVLYSVGGIALSGCAGMTINGIEMSPEGLVRAAVEVGARAAVREVRSDLASGRAKRLGESLRGQALSVSKPLPADVLSVVESDYQSVVDELAERIRRVQKGSPTAESLQVKGLMRTPKLVVVNDTEQINAWSRDDVAEPKVFVPSNLLVRSLLRLQAEQQARASKARDIFSIAFTGFTSYVPYIEFEEMLRLVLAHELTHLWLHSPGLEIRQREIEADAWGVALSASLSEVLAFRAKAGRMVMTGGFSTSDPFDMALMSSRDGFEVLEYLYGDEGVLAQSGDRQSLPERRKSVEAKYSEVFDKYISTLKDRDVALFGLMRRLL